MRMLVLWFRSAESVNHLLVIPTSKITNTLKQQKHKFSGNLFVFFPLSSTFKLLLSFSRGFRSITSNLLDLHVCRKFLTKRKLHHQLFHHNSQHERSRQIWVVHLARWRWEVCTNDIYREKHPLTAESKSFQTLKCQTLPSSKSKEKTTL